MDESGSDYQKIMRYVDDNPVAVIGTTNDDGSPHAAAVYVCTASHHSICFITRNLTKQYQNMYARPQVSVTIYNERDSSTLQATGTAFVVNDPHIMDYVTDKVNSIHAIHAEWISPIAKLRNSGDLVVIGIEFDYARLAEYHGLDVNAEESFTEIREN